MDLTKIMERLSSFPEHGICVYNGDGQLERKPFPEEFGNKTSRQLIEDYDLNLLLLAKKDVWPTTTGGQWTAYIDAENPPDTRVRQVATKNNDEEYTPAIAFSSGSSGKIKGMTINPHGIEDTASRIRRADHRRPGRKNRGSSLEYIGSPGSCRGR